MSGLNIQVEYAIDLFNSFAKGHAINILQSKIWVGFLFASNQNQVRLIPCLGFGI